MDEVLTSEISEIWVRFPLRHVFSRVLDFHPKFLGKNDFFLTDSCFVFCLLKIYSQLFSKLNFYKHFNSSIQKNFQVYPKGQKSLKKALGIYMYFCKNNNFKQYMYRCVSRQSSTCTSLFDTDIIIDVIFFTGTLTCQMCQKSQWALSFHDIKHQTFPETTAACLLSSYHQHIFRFPILIKMSF